MLKLFQLKKFPLKVGNISAQQMLTKSVMFRNHYRSRNHKHKKIHFIKHIKDTFVYYEKFMFANRKASE